MKNKPKALYTGNLELPVYDFFMQSKELIIINCSNLDNDLRVIKQKDFYKILGRNPNPPSRKGSGDFDRLPDFLASKNLKPYVDKHFEISTNLFDVISYIPLIEPEKINRGRASGYDYNLLIPSLKVYRDAFDDGALYENQLHIGLRSKELLDAFAGIAIISLIDEATGYQYDRPKDTLQAALALYLADQPNKWERRFTENFYKAIAKLRGWNYSKGKRAGAYSYYTVDLIYKRIQPGLWEELKKSNPNKKKYRYHQMLSEHIGNPHLKEHLRAITRILEGSSSWNFAMASIDRFYPLNNIQLNIFFDLLVDSPDDFDKYKDLVS